MNFNFLEIWAAFENWTLQVRKKTSRGPILNFLALNSHEIQKEMLFLRSSQILEFINRQCFPAWQTHSKKKTGKKKLLYEQLWRSELIVLEWFGCVHVWWWRKFMCCRGSVTMWNNMLMVKIYVKMQTFIFITWPINFIAFMLLSLDAISHSMQVLITFWRLQL